MNYMNDDFYFQWYHQWFFTITEVISTSCVIQLCNSDNQIVTWKLFTIMLISIVHVLVNCSDQFINNVLLNNGKNFQIVRDIGLLLPDVLNILISFYEIILAQKKGVSIFKLLYRREICAAMLSVISVSLLVKNL